MLIYEMIFNKGNNEVTSLFYKRNTADLRRKFVNYIRLELEIEFNKIKKKLLSNDNKELLDFYENIYRESFLEINEMEERFIKFSNSEINYLVNLSVKTHEIIS